MRVFALLLMLFMGVAIFGGDSAAAQSSQESKVIGKKRVEVRRGDTLTKIAKKNKTTYPRLFDANKQIKDPDVIQVGQKIRIPHPDEKLKKRSLPTNVVSSGYESPAQYNQPRQVKSPSAHVNGGVWDRLAACESGGNWSINTGNGYYGGLQFNPGTWRANGGTGLPHQASKAEQIKVAENLRAARGFSPWPACSAKLGLN